MRKVIIEVIEFMGEFAMMMYMAGLWRMFGMKLPETWGDILFFMILYLICLVITKTAKKLQNSQLD